MSDLNLVEKDAEFSQKEVKKIVEEAHSWTSCVAIYRMIIAHQGGVGLKKWVTQTKLKQPSKKKNIY